MTRYWVWIAGMVLAGVVGAALLWLLSRDRDTHFQPTVPRNAASGELHPVVVNLPRLSDPRVLADEVNGEVPCSACHVGRTANISTTAADLDEFHQGLQMAHGTLSCLACHNADHYDTLRLADGRALRFSDSLLLCAQCHGPQYRDYQRGSHGGMTGHWDLTAGPRQRNTCVDCHDAHAPAFPTVQPAAGPRDRFGPASDHPQHREANDE